MARLADYFVVVGYDQEKAGEFGLAGSRGWSGSGSGPPVTVGRRMMLMLLQLRAPVSFALAAATKQGREKPPFSPSPPHTIQNHGPCLPAGLGSER